MDKRMIGIAAPAGNPPATREECRRRLAELNAEIAAIRTETAAADMDRQARRGRVDPARFAQAKAELRRKQAEAAEITLHLRALPGRKDALKDTLIAVLREGYDEDGWRTVMDEAHRRLVSREAA